MNEIGGLLLGKFQGKNSLRVSKLGYGLVLVHRKAVNFPYEPEIRLLGLVLVHRKDRPYFFTSFRLHKEAKGMTKLKSYWIKPKGLKGMCLSYSIVFTLFLYLGIPRHGVDINNDKFVLHSNRSYLRNCELGSFSVEALAVAKANFAIEHPFEHYPLELIECQGRLEKYRAKLDTDGIFKDILILHSALHPSLPLSVPEIVLNKLLNSQSHKDATIIDVGANVGQFAIPLAKQNYRVISFEPNVESCLKLKENLEKDLIDDQVMVFCSGISDVNGTSALGYVGERDPGSASYEIIDPSTKGAHVKCTVRMEPLLDTSMLENLIAFKTDTQGNEGHVLLGAEKLLRSPKHPRFLLIEFAPEMLKSKKTNPRDVLDFVASAGYVCTHLAFHHIIRKGSRIQYAIVDTPITGLVSPIVNFNAIIHALGPHGNWSKNGEKLVSSVQDEGGWTDLLCFG